MGAGYGWPKDAVDGALYALLAGGQVEALDKSGKSAAAKEIPQGQIGVTTFRNATTVVTAVHRIGVRSLLTSVGLPYKNNEEAAVIPQLLQKLKDLADDAGGAAPLPPRPETGPVDDLLGKHGNEQFVAVFEARDALLGAYNSWKAAKALKDTRLPRWDVLGRLLAHAGNRPPTYQVRPQSDAILANRSLLSDPDPVQPLVAQLSTDLRAALQLARERLIEARERELAALKDTDEWHRLPDEQWQKIFHANGLGPVEPLTVAAEAQLLATLDATPLRTWDDWIVAVPARLAKAREQAARLLEPKAVRVHPKATTLRTASDVEAYLSDLRTEIMAHIEDGKPVIV
jgi:hypothetical protein